MLRQLGAQHGQIVVVAEPRRGPMESADVSTDAGTARFDEPQLVPQRLDRLAPFMEVVGALMLQGPRHRVAAVFVADAQGTCKRAEFTVCRPPSFRGPPKLAQMPPGLFPVAVARGRFHHFAPM